MSTAQSYVGRANYTSPVKPTATHNPTPATPGPQITFSNRIDIDTRLTAAGANPSYSSPVEAGQDHRPEGQTKPAPIAKSQLMKLANALRSTGLSLSDALKRAWRVIRLKMQMLVRPVTFKYVKDDGSERIATGYYGVAPATKGQEKPTPPLVVKYYDTLVNGWRSFRAERLILS